jgi:hypothetical protein
MRPEKQKVLSVGAGLASLGGAHAAPRPGAALYLDQEELARIVVPVGEADAGKAASLEDVRRLAIARSRAVGDLSTLPVYDRQAEGAAAAAAAAATAAAASASALVGAGGGAGGASAEGGSSFGPISSALDDERYRLEEVGVHKCLRVARALVRRPGLLRGWPKLLAVAWRYPCPSVRSVCWTFKPCGARAWCARGCRRERRSGNVWSGWRFTPTTSATMKTCSTLMR